MHGDGKRANMAHETKGYNGWMFMLSSLGIFDSLKAPQRKTDK
jgi:hypothetical protein